ncbi:hypothetical protein HMPREF9533_03791, partial [Escherichia coli MS 60-1]
MMKMYGVVVKFTDCKENPPPPFLGGGGGGPATALLAGSLP